MASQLDREEQLNLINSLMRLTATGKIDWQRPRGLAPSDRRTAQTEDKQLGFIIQSVDGDGERPYKLEVFVSDETETGRLAPFATVRMTAVDEGGDVEINGMLVELYDLVHRRSTREDKMTRKLFKLLNDLDEKGGENSLLAKVPHN